jgi:hypothetical protein
MTPDYSGAITLPFIGVRFVLFVAFFVVICVIAFFIYRMIKASTQKRKSQLEELNDLLYKKRRTTPKDKNEILCELNDPIGIKLAKMEQQSHKRE